MAFPCDVGELLFEDLHQRLDKEASKVNQSRYKAFQAWKTCYDDQDGFICPDLALIPVRLRTATMAATLNELHLNKLAHRMETTKRLDPFKAVLKEAQRRRDLFIKSMESIYSEEELAAPQEGGESGLDKAISQINVHLAKFKSGAQYSAAKSTALLVMSDVFAQKATARANNKAQRTAEHAALDPTPVLHHIAEVATEVARTEVQLAQQRQQRKGADGTHQTPPRSKSTASPHAPKPPLSANAKAEKQRLRRQRKAETKRKTIPTPDESRQDETAAARKAPGPKASQKLKSHAKATAAPRPSKTKGTGNAQAPPSKRPGGARA